MPGIKRKTASLIGLQDDGLRKRSKKEEQHEESSAKNAFIAETATDSEPIVESDTASQSGEDDGVSWPSNTDEGEETHARIEEAHNGDGGVKLSTKEVDTRPTTNTGNSSKESHAKQKVERLERKAAKPNADQIARSKKLWERLRRKSHVPSGDRRTLVAELFGIITGRVKDFVFKHDSVRVIQTALKYATPDQRKMIARELKGEYRSLAESKYAKFLIGKLLVHGDKEIRDMIVPETYGHVRRLIKHPEASWILDDMYRGIATPSQRAIMLREWYGAEFALFQPNGKEAICADLKGILHDHPEKRTPIMRSLHDLINMLVQKNTTGFTMLHDAMLQYFLNVEQGSDEATEYLELLKSDEEGDLLKNLAFTKSGARLVCLALAHGNAKDRKHIVKSFKDTVQTLAWDTYGHQVLLTMYDVIDDTVLVSKSICSELVGKNPTHPDQEQNMLSAINHLNGRIPLIYPFYPTPQPSLLSSDDMKLLREIHAIRPKTSKKDPAARRKELISYFSPSFLALIESHTSAILRTSFGSQFVGAVVPEAIGDRAPALSAIAALASSGSSEEDKALFNTPHAGKLLKKLVTGGTYNKELGRVELVEPPLEFHDLFYDAIKGTVVDWATGSGSFVVVALMEAPGFSKARELEQILRRPENLAKLRVAARQGEGLDIGQQVKKRGKADALEKSVLKGNRGAHLLLEKLE